MNVCWLVGWLAWMLTALHTAADPRTVAATVDGQPIYADQVDLRIERALAGRRVEPAVLDKLRRATLQQLIDRRLVQQYLAGSSQGASDAQVDRAVERLQRLADQQQILWSDYLHREGLDEPRLRDRLAWEIGWTQFVEQQATDENLRRYFDQHRAQFDGRTVRTAHILLRVDAPPEDPRWQQTVERARQLRQEIVEGTLGFAAAAAEYSQAPTADQAGELGWIERRGPMPEAFTAAAFALEVGQLSEPVSTAFGVHLIQCLDIRPGDTTWQQARDDLHQAVKQHLYHWAADRQSQRVPIEIHRSFR
jgi:parvulin-like peptidyl-prolyl isomerase